jgi:predicted MPP superfamily phosphohydrolase
MRSPVQVPFRNDCVDSFSSFARTLLPEVPVAAPDKLGIPESPITSSSRILPRHEGSGSEANPREQAEEGGERHRWLPRSIRRVIESTWSPGGEYLPPRRFVEACGNSAEPFRTSQERFLPSDIRRGLQNIRASERHIELSKWSTLYQYEVYHPRISSRLDGIRILHLSDVHLTRKADLPVQELCVLADHLDRDGRGIDIVVFTGDLLTYLPDDLSQAALAALRRLTKFACHSFFVHGNHDYHGKTPATVSKFIGAAGFEEITNRVVSCSIDGARVGFIGVDDAYFGRPLAPPNLGISDFKVVLVHNLDAIRANFPGDVDLFLSGHTHWGELRAPRIGSLRCLDGMWWMGRYGYSDDVNQHTKGWDALSSNSLSFVHPGLARHYVPHHFAFAPGFVLHTLRAPGFTG